MPTIFAHTAIPLSIGFGLGRDRISARLLAIGVAASIIPDLDVIAFRFGIPYAADFGHRGFTHSLCFAFGTAFLGTLSSGYFRTRFRLAFAYLFVSAASHGILDALTNGGLGIALLWPFSSTRYFAPFQMIEVSPLSLAGFLSRRGLEVLESELVWVWLPCMLFALLIRISVKAKPPWIDRAG